MSPRPTLPVLLVAAATLSSCLPVLAQGAAGSTTQTAGTPALTAEAIMARVAVNQDRAEAERAHFVYVQHAHVQSRKGGKPVCDEVTDTRITPLPTGQRRTLLALDGHLRDHGRTIHYTAMPQDVPNDVKDGAKANTSEDGSDAHVSDGDKETLLDADAHNAPLAVNDTDIDLVENMRRNFTSDKDSKDGVNAGLFPLTSKQQKEMLFDLKGRELKNGRDTFHITFRPKDKDDFGWKGDAWVDAQAFQPVVVRTALSRSIPLGVRLLLGTNVPGLGFTVVYAPQGEVWFPESFGTEFKIHVLFAFHRQIIVDVANRSFERTHVSSTIHSEASASAPPASEQAPAPR